ncbi:MAG: hypothetical protein ABJC04_13475 [Verrucomicrobiota bacterium]
MNPQKIIEQIEKLIDEKFKVATILSAKSLGDSKELFLHESQQKIEQIKGELAEALGNSRLS